MMKIVSTLKLAVRIYRLKLLLLLLSIIIVLASRGFVLAGDPKPPPGSAPDPNIDPL
ncbi:MAG: hypothetical protein NZ954_05570 [Thermofilaceae archaeon]|nr:hypothetical protein [Thermofilaceae archaeon]MCX8180963.1 hypothetical protein [Thermofilaceae archaeon]MDW8004068.1 hypothetical protein [Thermofilaceae archaeon]